MSDTQQKLIELMEDRIREDLEEDENIDDIDKAAERAMQPIVSFLQDKDLLEQDESDLNQYPDLPLEDIHEGVREAIEDWQDAGEDGPLLYWLLQTGTPAYKMSKEESNYTNEAQDPRYSCATCEFLYTETASGKHICSQIRGEVEPEGWCKLWKLSEVFDHVDLSELEDQN